MLVTQTAFTEFLPASDSHLGNILALNKWIVGQDFRELGDVPCRDRREAWREHAAPFFANAQYFPFENAIDVPASLLQAQFGKDLPAAANFGRAL